MVFKAIGKIVGAVTSLASGNIPGLIKNGIDIVKDLVGGGKKQTFNERCKDDQHDECNDHDNIKKMSIGITRPISHMADFHQANQGNCPPVFHQPNHDIHRPSINQHQQQPNIHHQSDNEYKTLKANVNGFEPKLNSIIENVVNKNKGEFDKIILKDDRGIEVSITMPGAEQKANSLRIREIPFEGVLPLPENQNNLFPNNIGSPFSSVNPFQSFVNNNAQVTPVVYVPMQNNGLSPIQAPNGLSYNINMVRMPIPTPLPSLGYGRI